MHTTCVKTRYRCSATPDDIVNARTRRNQLGCLTVVPLITGITYAARTEVRCTFWCPIERLVEDLGSRYLTLSDCPFAT
jgi:hypothetical protein